MDTTIIDTLAACCDTVATLVEDPVVLVETVEDTSMSVLEFITTFWIELTIASLAFIKVVVNLTPTEKDNAIFGWLDTLISSVIPDRRKD
jgi:hypothetical protein